MEYPRILGLWFLNQLNIRIQVTNLDKFFSLYEQEAKKINSNLNREIENQSFQLK